MSKIFSSEEILHEALRIAARERYPDGTVGDGINRVNMVRRWRIEARNKLESEAVHDA